jgi:hypothetical protein
VRTYTTGSAVHQNCQRDLVFAMQGSDNKPSSEDSRDRSSSDSRASDDSSGSTSPHEEPLTPPDITNITPDTQCLGET